MKANYRRKHLKTKQNKALVQYTRDYTALCILHGVDRANEILQKPQKERASDDLQDDLHETDFRRS